MIISHQYKYVFLHIPKTAGTSIQVALGLRAGILGRRLANNYTLIGETQHHVVPEEIPQDYFVFTFVRNPWDRILSYYMFRNEPRNSRRLSIHPEERIITFKEWLNRLDEFKKYRRINPAFKIAIQPQMDTINDYPNFIGKYENLEEDLKFICQKINREYKTFKNVNPTTKKKKHYSEYYDDETKDLVADLYKKDIEYFGYNF